MRERQWPRVGMRFAPTMEDVPRLFRVRNANDLAALKVENRRLWMKLLRTTCWCEKDVR